MHVKVQSEARRQHWILLELELQAVTNHTTWMLGTKLQSLARAGSPLHDDRIFNVIIAC